MPVYDYKCESCEHVEENMFFLCVADMEEAEAKGIRCPECDGTMRKLPARFSTEYGKVADSRGQMYPGSKEERRKMMADRYRKRNKRLENLPPDQQERMKRLFRKYNVRKTPPSDPKTL